MILPLRAPSAPWRHWLLRALSLGLFLALLGLMGVQWRQMQLLERSLSMADNASGWPFFQVDFEAVRVVAALQEARLDAHVNTDHSEWAERVDIFISRLNVLGRDRPERVFQSSAHSYQSTIDALYDWVRVADAITVAAKISPQRQPSSAELEALQVMLESLQPMLHELCITAFQGASEHEDERIQAINRLNIIGFITTCVFGLLSLSLLLLLVNDSRLIRRRGEALEALTERLEQARTVADSANQAKSAFLATMSHELRTPLHGMLGMLDLLSTQPPEEQRRRYLQTARDAAHHLLALLNDILDMSRLESGRLTLSTSPVDLWRLLDDVGSVMQAAARARGLKLDLARAVTVPQWVRADDTRVRQVLFNLLSNAIKFTPEGEVSLRVETHTQGLSFEVRDTGIGMDDATLERLFQRFSQGDAGIARRYGGTGLGLVGRRSRGTACVRAQPRHDRPAPCADAGIGARTDRHPAPFVAAPRRLRADARPAGRSGPHRTRRHDRPPRRRMGKGGYRGTGLHEGRYSGVGDAGLHASRLRPAGRAQGYCPVACRPGPAGRRPCHVRDDPPRRHAGRVPDRKPRADGDVAAHEAGQFL